MQRKVTFVLRVTVDEAGQASGVVEVVRTGRKEPVRDIRELSAVVMEMLRAESLGPALSSRPDP